MLNIPVVQDHDEFKRLFNECDLIIPEWKPSNAIISTLKSEVESSNNPKEETEVIVDDEVEKLNNLIK